MKKLSSEFKPMLQEIHSLSGHPKDPMWGTLANETPASPPSDNATKLTSQRSHSFSPGKWLVRFAVGGGMTAAALLLSPILLPLILLIAFAVTTVVVRKMIILGGKEEKKTTTATLHLPGALTQAKGALEERKKK